MYNRCTVSYTCCSVLNKAKYYSISFKKMEEKIQAVYNEKNNTAAI